MKWRALILILTLTCPTAPAQDLIAKDPRARAAIGYLRSIADNKLDVATDTALSKNCGLARRRIIRDQLEIIRKNYLRHDDIYTVDEIKTEGKLAAALIQSKSAIQPMSPRVHAVALINKNQVWKPAPLLGSFANSGYGFDDAVEKQVLQLERWMAQQKIKRETSYKEHAASTIKTALQLSEQQMKLDGISPEEAVQNFILLCRSKDLTKILASMGAASGALTDPLETISNTIAEGLAVRDIESNWYNLSNSSTAFAVMSHDDKRKEVAVGFYNPMLRRQSRVLYFPTLEQDGKQFVRLSPYLKAEKKQRWRHRRDGESKLLLEVPHAILNSISPRSHASPEKLLSAYLEAAHTGDFRDAIKLLPRSGQPFNDKKKLSILLANFASEWQRILGLKSGPKPESTLLKHDHIAVASLQFASPTKPGKIITQHVWMMQPKEAWNLIPENTLIDLKDADIAQAVRLLKRKLSSLEEKQSSELSKKMLSLVTAIDLNGLKKSPNHTESTNLYQAYRNHLRSGDRRAALRACAALDLSDSTKTLRKFNYALRGARAQLNDDKILCSLQLGPWTALSVRTHTKLTDEHHYPMILCAQTEHGPKLLLDIDLRYASNKGRELLNQAQWNALKKSLPATEIQNIQKLFADHLKQVKKDQQAQKELHE